jgi:hypothetical protein
VGQAEAGQPEKPVTAFTFGQLTGLCLPHVLLRALCVFVVKVPSAFIPLPS